MKVLTTIDLLALPNLETPPTGHVGFGAKSDGLYQKVGTVETKLSIDGHTHTIAQITGLQGALDLKATPADITNAISAIEIGGRNYIFKPSLWQTLGGFSVNEYTIIDSDGNYYSNTRSNTFNLYAGQSYTLSFDVLQVEGSFDAQVIISPSTTIFRKYGIILGRNVYTFTPSQNYVGAELRFFGVNQTTSLLLEVINIKLEKGNKATDWTPAPEDQISDWNETDVNSFAFLKNKPTQLSQFTDNIGVGIHIANTSNPHAVTTAQIGAVDLTTNQSIGGVKTFTNTLRVLTPDASITAKILCYPTSPYGLVFRSLSSGNHSIQSQRESSDAEMFTLSLNPNGGNVGIGTTNPLYKLDVAGTGRFTGNVTAPTFIGALSGNASTATKLSSNRTYALTGDVAGSASNDLASGFSITTTLENSGVTAGTYRSVTVDAKGRVTAGTNPTTVAGYGITDAVTTDTAQTITGTKTFSAALTASVSVTTPKVIFAAAGWSLEQVGTEIQYKYNGVVKQRMLSDGSIVATGEVTAFVAAT